LGWCIALVACDDAPGSAGCYGVCGEGTQCSNGKCIVAQAQAPAEPVLEPDDKPSKRRRRGKPKPGEPQSAFTPEDDSRIPEYDPNKVQVIDMKSGSARLDDSVVRSHLGKLEPQFNACIETAAEHSEEELRGGEVDFVFTIAGTGKVQSVTVKAPPQLRVFGIVPCLRNALSRHRFPAFDGPTMGVDYSFEVG
jgi:hypothetical protein